MIRLRKEQIILMHRQLIDATGGIHGIRDEGMLESALAAPYAGFEDEDFFPSVEEKAARTASMRLPDVPDDVPFFTHLDSQPDPWTYER